MKIKEEMWQKWEVYKKARDNKFNAQVEYDISYEKLMIAKENWDRAYKKNIVTDKEFKKLFEDWDMANNNQIEAQNKSWIADEEYIKADKDWDIANKHYTRFMRANLDEAKRTLFEIINENLKKEIKQ